VDHNRHIKDAKDNDRYRELLRISIEFFIYIYYTDSAYRDIGNFMLWRFKEELKKHPELEQYLDNEVKSPDKFYYNQWENTRMETKLKQQKGELSVGELCDSEKLLVDEVQKNVVEDYVKRNIEVRKKFEHW
jgi:hypothetical protein